MIHAGDFKRCGHLQEVKEFNWSIQSSFILISGLNILNWTKIDIFTNVFSWNYFLEKEFLLSLEIGSRQPVIDKYSNSDAAAEKC